MSDPFFSKEIFKYSIWYVLTFIYFHNNYFLKKQFIPLDCFFYLKIKNLVKKRPQHCCWGLEEGSDILSHQMAVPSALMGLTSLFGKGRGEPHRYNHLNFRSVFALHNIVTNWETNKKKNFQKQFERKSPTIGLRVISITRLRHCCLYTYDLST